jgi:Predicted ATPase (AAA+ superfamily)
MSGSSTSAFTHSSQAASTAFTEHGNREQKGCTLQGLHPAREDDPRRPTLFDLCTPRPDVLKGAITEADFAADLAQVIRGNGPEEYARADLFFSNTYPTRGLKSLLANVCARLSGMGGEVASIFRLDTSYGGGKTHGLIALVHAARGMLGVPNVQEFIDPTLLPKSKVRIAAFDGENADPANGRAMGDGVLAFTPWGEIAYRLAGKAGYERIRRSDEHMVAPGAETLRELFGGEPALILLDELSVYLRKVRNMPKARDQLTAFLTSLFKAIESTPNAALVYTLAIGKEGRATDAYSEENQFIADQMAEAESVSARKATLLNPTEDDETVQVLRRRLFERIDKEGATPVIEAYRTLWTANREALAHEAVRPETLEAFRASYPLHPEVLETLTGKTATLANFQRVRGMLRLLARTVANVWTTKPADATAIHLHHIDPGYEPIRQELVTRLSQSAYVPAISNDVAAAPGKKALALEIDEAHYAGLLPFTTYVARTVLLHSLAYNEPLKGLSPEHLRFSMLNPALDISFIEDARKRFMAGSAYLDDRPGVPMRFLVEANLTQIIRRQEQHVDPGEARAQLNDWIKKTFSGSTFESVPFPGGPFDVPDEVGDGRPKLVVLSYDAVAVGHSIESIPDLVERIFSKKGSDGVALRALRNNLVFVVADEARKDEMRHKMYRRLALEDLKKPERLAELAEHQQARIKELEARSQQELALAIQQCYRHLFYPSRSRLGDSQVDLAHSAIDIQSASDKPGAGQQQVMRALRDLKKLRLPEDEPDSPIYVRDKTPLKKGQIPTLALRDEFRRDPGLPILGGDDIFIRGIRHGVESGEYVYRRGELLYGPEDPSASILIDEQAVVFTMTYAKEHGIWPRPAPKPEPENPEAPKATGVRDDPEPKGTVGPGGAPSQPEPRTDTQPALTAEGVLWEALTKLWEQARAKKVERITALTIRMFEASDAFRLLSAVNAVSSATKRVTFTGGYETKEGGEMQLEFRGSVTDAQPVKEFLDAQLRDAASRNLEAAFEMKFNGGLSMMGDAAEKLTERLARFASGAAYVSATAEV